jgi:very-short-patch-repair endonuclease
LLGEAALASYRYGSIATMTKSLPEIARAQHGLLAHGQAAAILSEGQLRARLRDGRLEVVRRGVYRVGGAPDTWEQAVLAAVLSVPGSCASFRSAAALWTFEGFGRETVEITVPGRRRTRLEDVIVHDSVVTGPGHVGRAQGIPVASPERTLCDLSAVVPAWSVERAVDEALRRKLVSLRSLARVSKALETKGRRRSTVMRGILERRLPGYEPGESAPERRIANLLVRAGLPAPVLQHRVRVGGRTLRIDLAYPETGIAIEYDGWSVHSTRSAFDRDRARANDLVVLGMKVLRFTSASSDQQIVDTVSSALTRASVS